MKTMKRFILGIAALMVTLAACTELTDPEELSREPIPQGMGQVHIQLYQPNARTALPGIKDLYFTLDFTGPKTVPAIILDNGTTLTVALESGDWKLVVKGYRDSSSNMDSPMLKGESSITVTAGISSNVVVDLKPDFSSGGTGTLSYNVSFPDTVSQAFLVLYPTGQKIDILGSATGIEPLPAGSYQAFIDLYDNTNNTAAVWTGVVHIYDGSDTFLEQKFEDTNFASPQVVGKDKTTLAEKLADAFGSSLGSCTIVLDKDEILTATQDIRATGDAKIAITIDGNGKALSLDKNGSVLTLGADSGSSLTLILEDITLKGKGGNNASVVQVNSRGTLELTDGSRLTGNSTSSIGGGVYVAGGGTLSMSGGEISGNTTTISGSSNVGGGGVFIDGGTFTMSGGKISGNANIGASTVRAGGVYVNGGIFTMSGGEISGNTASGNTVHGGGVHLTSNGTFIMSGGTISGNTASSSSGVSYGGGVYITSKTFTMTGGVIYGSNAGDGKANTAGTSGAAIYKNGGTSSHDTTNNTIEIP